MSTSFNLEHPDFFTAGAVGPKGQRVFYLQAREAGRVVSLRLEKQQVGALADYLEHMLADLPERTVAAGDPDLALIEPVVADWVIGGLGVAYDEQVDRIVLVAEELQATADDEPEPEERRAMARFHLRRDQIVAFVSHSRSVVAAGRPPCPYCGWPLDPVSGFCPCSN
jgi:uncharacterized repeat protein (TIGR03847 family)